MHEHPLLSSLTADTLTRPRYTDILKAFYGFYSVWEEYYIHFTGTFAHEATPLIWLEEDFGALGIQPPDTKTLSIPETPPDFSSYIGYLYLKQGSTLGGQYISSKLQKHLGLKKGENLFFFNGFGRQTGENWRHFLEYLDQQQINIALPRATQSAQNSFAFMDRYFTHIYRQARETDA